MSKQDRGRSGAILPRLVALATAWLFLGLTAAAQIPGGSRAQYDRAEEFSSSKLRPFLYSSSVDPQWIAGTDRFWYSYRTSEGRQYWLVDPDARTKVPMFDHHLVAERVSEAVRKPIDAKQLSLSRASVDRSGEIFSFQVEGHQFSYDMSTEALEHKGKARSRSSSGRRSSDSSEGQQRSSSSSRSSSSRSRSHRVFSPDRTAYVFGMGHDLYYVEASDEVKAQVREIEERRKAERETAEAEREAAKEDESESEDGETQSDSTGKADIASGESNALQESEKNDQEKQDQQEETVTDEDSKKEEGETSSAQQRSRSSRSRVDERERWALDIDESKALRLTNDGEDNYAYVSSRSRSSRSRSDSEEGSTDQQTRKARPSVSWSPDSKAFYVSRRDRRGIKELFLVNSIAEPRPTLQSYSYTMPGEDTVSKSELFVFDRPTQELRRVPQKWKDESYQNLQWTEGTHELRFLRRDRLLRNAEYCALDASSLEADCLIMEGFDEANLSLKSPRYIRDRSEIIWWSERSGWGHYYLYDRDGTLKNPITRGQFRASSIVSIDLDKGLMYFQGNGREEGENIYYQHLYRVFLDGTGLTLMDPGDAHHNSKLSPTKRYIVDNCSRIDMAPLSLVRDHSGEVVMQLEEMDLSRLQSTGWTMPETFTVKAADGVTDLYGNLWKPFDFDPNKRYPIIASVYPGPQMEGVSHTFSATSSTQQLAQLGFIVVQVGHRGGTPKRSKAYHSHGYFNLRDYGLADKKAALEELGRRHSFIDLDRVGIYGHSGGGFMTAAALMKKPYNEFFKVGVATSGNHDNNIYNASWAERYHGMKEVAVQEEQEGTTRGRSSRSNQGRTRSTSSSGAFWEQESDQDEQNEQDDSDKRENTEEGEDEDDSSGQKKRETKFEIDVPTNAELAANLRGHLLLVHGEIDNNVHPANTMRLAHALMKAGKRFDMLIVPGARHGFGEFSGYVRQRTWEYFAEHLLGDYQTGADIEVKERPSAD